MSYDGSKNQVSYSGHLMKKGVAAELIVSEWLATIYDSVEDVSLLKDYQKKEIDFIVNNDPASGIECKGDSYIGKTRNMLYECERHTAKGDFKVKPGWSTFSEAASAVYVCDGMLYIITMKDLREAYRENSALCAEKRKSANCRYILTDCERTTMNILIPESIWGKYTTIITLDKVQTEDGNE